MIMTTSTSTTTTTATSEAAAMSYGIRTVVDAPFAETLERVRAALQREGFGVLTEIDFAATLRAKIGAEMDPYVVLGACNPPLAHQALTAEPAIGLLLPCNVAVRADGERTIVEALDPQVMVTLTGNAQVQASADDATARLRAALAALGDRVPPASG